MAALFLQHCSSNEWECITVFLIMQENTSAFDTVPALHNSRNWGKRFSDFS